MNPRRDCAARILLAKGRNDNPVYEAVLSVLIMDIAVVGPGAVGTTVAAYLFAAGHPVQLCGRTPRPQIELRPDGAEAITVPGPICTDPADIVDPAGLVLLAVKATQNADAARWLSRLCDEKTIVVVLQNGVEQVEQVQPLCPSATVLPGIVWFSAETQPDGWVRLRGEARLALPTGAAATTFADLWRAAGGTADCDPDFRTAAWRKLLVNAVAGLMVLTGRRSGMFRRNDLAELAYRYAAECLEVARAEGAQLTEDVAAGTAEMFRSAPADMGTSMLADRVASRPLEWDIRNGVIVRKARMHGIATPISDIVVSLLAAASDGPG
jgi:2-dehydropantoate 2-reductase